ncbi:hypothetical protein ScPMuIL_009743 [Solemya velum]
MLSAQKSSARLRNLKWHRIRPKIIEKSDSESKYSPEFASGLWAIVSPYHTNERLNENIPCLSSSKLKSDEYKSYNHCLGRRSLRKNSTFSIDSKSNTDYDNAKPFSQIPGPIGLPYLGTLFQYRKGPFQRFDIDHLKDAVIARYRQYGAIMKETVSGVTVVHLFHPDFIRTVFQSEGKIPHIAPLMETTQRYRKLRNLSPGLGNSNGDEWYRLRSAVQQMMMRPKAVTAYLPLVNEVASDFVDGISRIKDSNGDVPNFLNEIAKWNIESSGMTCFEKRLGCFDAGKDSLPQKMIDANSEIFRLSTVLKFSVPWFRLFQTPTWKKVTEAEDFFFGTGQGFVDECVSEINRISERGELTEDKFLFMAYLLSRPELTYKDISIITLSLFGDGLNTTSPTLLWNLYCLAKNQDVQQKVHEEVCQVIPENQPITAEMINKLVYLKAFVKETFRFYPIGLDVARVPQENLVIGGYQVPAGTHVEMNNFVLFSLSEYFNEPEKFLPERWLRGGDAQNIHPFILTPFGHGPRMCAGRRFAEQEMYVVISKLLQRYRLEWHHEDLNQKFQMLMIPDKPATFTFVDRHKN